MNTTEQRKKSNESAFLKALPSRRRKQKQMLLKSSTSSLSSSPPEANAFSFFHKNKNHTAASSSSSSIIISSSNHHSMNLNSETTTNQHVDSTSYTNRLQVSSTQDPQETMQENVGKSTKITDHTCVDEHHSIQLQTLEEFIEDQNRNTQIFISTHIANATLDLKRTIQQLMQENQHLKEDSDTVKKRYEKDIIMYKQEISKLKSELSKIGNLYHETRLKYEHKKKTMATFLETLPFQIDEDGQIILKTKMNMTDPNLGTTPANMNLEESQYPLDVLQVLQHQETTHASHSRSESVVRKDALVQAIQHAHESRPILEYRDEVTTSNDKDSMIDKPRRVTLDANTAALTKLRQNQRKESNSSEESDETKYNKERDSSKHNEDVSHYQVHHDSSNLSPPLTHVSVKQEESPEKSQESFLESASAFNPNFELTVDSGSSQSEEEEDHLHPNSGSKSQTRTNRNSRVDPDARPSPIPSSIRSVTPMTQQKHDTVNQDVHETNTTQKRLRADDNNDDDQMSESKAPFVESKETTKRSKLKLHRDAPSLLSHKFNIQNQNHPSKEHFKYKEVVRGKNAREALKGFDCEQCGGFFNAILEGKGSEVYNRNDLICKCSRHRSKWSPDKTPKDFWEMSFADSIAAREKGVSGQNEEENHDDMKEMDHENGVVPSLEHPNNDDFEDDEPQSMAY